MSVSSHSNSVTNEDRKFGVHTGRVKWFNKKSGYGFIVDNSSDVDEVFVHYKDIVVDGDDTFRYLVEGEYVTFDVEDCENNKVKAVNIRGIKGGVLMCQTNKDRNQTRNNQRHNVRPNNKNIQRRFKQADGKTVLMRRVVSYVPVKERNTKKE